MLRFVGLCCVIFGMAGLLYGELAASSPANGDIPLSYGRWISGRIGGGGYLINGTIWGKDPRIIHWYSDVAGVFRSEDGGRQWRMIHGSCQEKLTCVRSLLVDPRDDKKLLVAAGSQWDEQGGIFATHDAGQSWRKVLSAQFYANEPLRYCGVVLARDPNAPDTVYAASSPTGLHKSTDNGETWRHLGMNDLNVADIKIDLRQSNRLWICAKADDLWHKVNGKAQKVQMSGGLFLSEDAGESWQKMGDVAPSEMIQCRKMPDLIYGILEHNRIAYSTDNGATWHDVTDGIKYDPAKAKKGGTYSYSYNALGAGGDFLLTVSGEGEVFRMQAGADKWEYMAPHSIDQGDWYGRRMEERKGWDYFGRFSSSIVVDPTDPAHWLFSDWYALYQTRDAGASWTLAVNGIEATCILCVTADPANPEVVHMGMGDNGYFRSEDGGATYRQPEVLRTSTCKSISVSPTLPDRIYMTGTNSGQWFAKSIFISNDNGKSWARSLMTGLPQDRHLNSIIADPVNPDVAWVTVSGRTGKGDGGVYRTTDGGERWEWDGNGLPAGESIFREQIWLNGTGLAVDSAGTKVLAAYNHARIYYSAPNSATWQAGRGYDGGTPYEVCADPTLPGRFFVAGEKGIYRSVDGGATWERVYSSGAVHITCDARRSGRVAAGLKDWQGIAMSIDGGQNWVIVDPALPHRDWNPLAFAGDVLIAGSAGNGMFSTQLTSAEIPDEK